MCKRASRLFFLSYINEDMNINYIKVGQTYKKGFNQNIKKFI